MGLDIPIFLILMLLFSALGKRVFKLTGTRFSNFVEEIVFCYGLGAGIVALLTLGIGLLGGLKRWTFYLLIFGLLAVLIRDVKDIFIDGIAWIRAKRTKLRKFDVFLLTVLLLHFSLTFFSTLGPCISWDSLTHHLLVPKIYIEDGRIFNMSPTEGWFVVESNYPSNMEMLYTAGMIIGSDVLASLIAWSVSIFLAVSVYSLSRQFFSFRTSLLAMVVLYCAPIVAVRSTHALVDTGVAFFAFLSLYSVIKWTHSSNYRLLIFSGVYAGLCAGTKYTGLPVVLVLGFLILLLSILDGKKITTGIEYSLVFGMIALATVIPWHIKNYVYTGNPVYPFFARILGGMNLPPRFRSYGVATGWKGIDDYGNWYNLLASYIRLPWDLTMMVSPFQNPQSSIGPLYLLFIPPLIFIRNVQNKIKYLLLYGLLGLTIVFVMAQRPRYMFPFIPPLAIVASYSLCEISERDRLIKAVSFFVASVVIVFSIVLLLTMVSSRGLVILGIMPEKGYLSVVLSNHEAISYINENLPKSARILSTDSKLYYCKSPSVYDMAVIDYESLQGDEMKLLDELKRLNISFILISKESLAYRTDPARDLYERLVKERMLVCIFALPRKGVAVYMVK